MNIIRIDESFKSAAAPLIAEFRAALNSYRGIASRPSLEEAGAEYLWLLEKGYPVFAAEENGELLGYAVCRVEDGIVWVEQLYTREAARRRGVGTLLFEKAEELARSMGESTVYNYIHPNNDGVIAFLRSRGYTVLNLIEVRKPYEGEKPRLTVRVNEHSFDY